MNLTGVTWRKSSRSNGSGGGCVEAADAAREVAVRDSKNPNGPKLGFTRDQFGAFLTGTKTGRYDM